MAIAGTELASAGTSWVPHVAEGIDLSELRLYTTEDGGASWLVRDFPYVASPPGIRPANTRLPQSPTMVFDESGTLHFLASMEDGFASNFVGVTGFQTDVFYLRSQDLGQTWSTPEYLTNDRSSCCPHAHRAPGGEIVAFWNGPVRDDPRIAMGITRDGGNEWDIGTFGEGLCYRPSEPVFLTDVGFVACSIRGEETGYATALFRFNLTTGSVTNVSVVETMDDFFPHLMGLGNDSLLLVSGIDASRSDDGGRTWGPVLDLRNVTKTLQRPDYQFNKFTGLDPWGLVHLVLSGEEYCDDETCTHLVHVVLDPEEMVVVQEGDLVPPKEDWSERFPPNSAGLVTPEVRMAFAKDFGVVAWNIRGWVEYSFLEPRWGSKSMDSSG